VWGLWGWVRARAGASGTGLRRVFDAFVRPWALGAADLARVVGIGHIAVGMHRQGFDLQLTQYDERGWRATFYTWEALNRMRGTN
jgi:hypothetical protein